MPISPFPGPPPRADTALHRLAHWSRRRSGAGAEPTSVQQVCGLGDRVPASLCEPGRPPGGGARADGSLVGCVPVDGDVEETGAPERARPGALVATPYPSLARLSPALVRRPRGHQRGACVGGRQGTGCTASKAALSA
ncbi:hypothetical protein PtB15_11B280 [Puccinia triticina]|nr:hypothetical protein PtB15_11B280 [Puccinia triticina]